MGFLDKINYSKIVNSFKQVCKRGHREVFCKGVLLIVIRCNEVTNFLIPSVGN